MPAVHIDGTQPLSADLVATITALCDTAEAAGAAAVILNVTGTPGAHWASDLTVGLVSKWERAVRRLERLPATTVAVADGDCGGPALDCLLATDYRVVTPDARLVLPLADGATWPGMALFRLAQESGGAASVRRAVLFGTPITAAEALDMRLVDELTDDVPRALAVVTELSGRAAASELAVRRQLLLDARTVEFEEALGAHLAACDRMLRRAAR